MSLKTMLAVISPAKTLDLESSCPTVPVSQPDFLDQAEELIGMLRKKRRPELSALMGISEKLADLSFAYFREWERPFTDDNARPALLTFKGAVFTGFALDEYTKRDFQFAQKHLRILSGLYGVLRPLDLMQAYRLEMGTPLKTRRGKDLYTFWNSLITEAIRAALAETGTNTLVNLASQEYYRSIRESDLDVEVITPVFKDLKNGKYKVLSLFAKKARGAMCDLMIRERLTKPTGLKRFNCAGYRFNPGLSEGNTWTFTRDGPPQF